MDILTERTNKLALDDGDYEEEEEREESARVSLKRLSNVHKLSRRRRRSSARFLKLPESNNNDEDDEDRDGASAANCPSTQDLGQVYKNAIRMNAENKINASNSWNLNLIDHMDRFLGRPSMLPSSQEQPMEDTLGPISGVNFTKASCTLDASVKIYSYRVDDVHLTSYKVLANLNRTDHGKKKGKDKDSNSSNTSEQEEEAREQRRAARSNADTLETNLANINIHKLDAAFDIDPLFHKMSKTFDEGGAKGLLLANLGVSTKGCNIVFDSTLEDPKEAESKQAEDGEDGTASVDISTLQARMETSLSATGQTLYQTSLVPQLVSLRADYHQLKNEGFVEQIRSSDRYAAPQEAEVEADRSIHVEAIERSRASQADIGRSLMARDDDEDTFGDDDDDGAGFAADDFGGGDDDDFDDNGMATDVAEDIFPVSFSIHDGDHRFSSESFQTTFAANQPPSQATVLLDAIASGDISGSQSNYEYYNRKALESIQGNNQWAGSAHWKKMVPKRTKTKDTAVPEESEASTAAVPVNKKKRSKAKANLSGGLLIDISKSTADINALLKKPPRAKKGASNPLQMTKAAVSKASKNENLLPMDAGIKVENFTSLFSRPNTNVMDLFAASAVPTRQVGFGGVETWGNDENSYGDDDQGAGFDFGGGDYDDNHDEDPGDFVVPELEGIRKVDKVKIGYATVAKKVDVKRLKKDLWQELERTFEERNMKVAAVEPPADCDDENSMDSVVHDAEQAERMDEDAPPTGDAEPLSFQQTVKDMQASESQTDVTLPFYFICILHLANEKGLALESTGLEDFIIHSS